MNSRVKHHRACNRHDSTNVTLGNSVVMMCANPGKVHDLLKFGKVLSELGRSEHL
jgi:hypothetical protein